MRYGGIVKEDHRKGYAKAYPFFIESYKHHRYLSTQYSILLIYWTYIREVYYAYMSHMPDGSIG